MNRNQIKNGRIAVGYLTVAVALTMVGTLSLGQLSSSSSISAVRIGSDKRVHITYSDSKEFIAPEEKGQVDVTSLKIADDKVTAGWLVLERPDCCVNYPIALTVITYRNRRIMKHIRGEPLIWDWCFIGTGDQVAISIGPQHGENGLHFELRDARSGRLSAQSDVHSNGKQPPWTSGLKQ
jgi:hypothetical protein